MEKQNMTQDMIQRHKSNTRNQKPDTRTQHKEHDRNSLKITGGTFMFKKTLLILIDCRQNYHVIIQVIIITILSF